MGKNAHFPSQHLFLLHVLICHFASYLDFLNYDSSIILFWPVLGPAQMHPVQLVDPPKATVVSWRALPGRTHRGTTLQVD